MKHLALAAALPGMSLRPVFDKAKARACESGWLYDNRIGPDYKTEHGQEPQHRDDVIPAFEARAQEILKSHKRLGTLELNPDLDIPKPMADVESYRPTPEEEQRRAERRRTLVARLVRDLT